MISVLQILPSLNYCGGVENYLMNFFRSIDKSTFSFSFAYHLSGEPSFEEEIKQLGGKVYKLTSFSLKNIKKIEKEIDELLTNNHFDIIHCHQANAAFLYFKVAKKHGINVRIIHSHQTRGADKFSHRIRNAPLLWLGKKRSTNFVGCSHLAGRFLFGKKDYVVINNAINQNKFLFDVTTRKELRNEYHIDSDIFVVGNIGRLCNQKNQMYLVDICKLIINRGVTDIKFMIVGSGELDNQINNKIKANDLEKYFVMTGAITDTYRIYSAFDLFCLPSLYEGLPVVGVEAQVNNLEVITSTNVTGELNFSNNVSYLPLSDIDSWVKCVEEKYNSFKENGFTKRQVIKQYPDYDINVQVDVLAKYYEGLIDKHVKD